MRDFYNNKGNALFIILIAVALLGALSFAFTQSGRNANSNLSKEKVVMGAGAINAYITTLRQEVNRLMMRGCGVTNLDWRNGYWKRIDGNPSVGILHNPVAAKAGCAIFSDYGGKIPAQVDFSEFAAPTYESSVPSYMVKAGHGMPLWINHAKAGTSATDIGIEFRGLDPAICSYLLNPTTKPSGIYEAYGNQPDPNVADTYAWTGSNEVIDEPANIAGPYYAQFNPLAAGPSCFIGAVIVAR
jgi:hypothetical protein